MKISRIFNCENIRLRANTAFKRVKRVFNNVLDKDVFEKSTKEIDHIPNSIAKEGDAQGISISKIHFYKKDINKMKNMTDEECLKYKQYLIDNEKYYI